MKRVITSMHRLLFDINSYECLELKLKKDLQNNINNNTLNKQIDLKEVNNFSNNISAIKKDEMKNGIDDQNMLIEKEKLLQLDLKTKKELEELKRYGSITNNDLNRKNSIQEMISNNSTSNKMQELKNSIPENTGLPQTDINVKDNGNIYASYRLQL